MNILNFIKCIIFSINIELFIDYEYYIHLLPYLKCYVQKNETFISIDFELSLFKIIFNLDCNFSFKEFKLLKGNN